MSQRSQEQEENDPLHSACDEELEVQNNDELRMKDVNEDSWCGLPISLSIATILGAFIGAGIGVAITLSIDELPEDWENILGFPGELWVRALKLMVLPLIVLLMVVLPSRVSDIGSKGTKTLGFYMLSSIIAACEGLVWVNIINPGSHGEAQQGSQEAATELSELDSFLTIFRNAVPSNIVTAMGDLTILGVIVFFLILGMLLQNKEMPEQEREAVLNFARAILKCVMQAVIWIVQFTPIGMLSLVLVKIASTENLPSLLEALGYYLLTVVIGHSIHVFLFYPLLFYIITRGNGWKWFYKIFPAPLLAFATSSSAATLPRSLQVADAADVHPEVYNFVLPLGAAINMDGTALGFPIMVMFIAQLNGITIKAGTQIVIALLATVCSIGTAPIPNAGMVYILMLLTAAGLEQFESEAIATLFVLDWFVDRIETAVNVTSDQFVAKMVDHLESKAAKKGDQGGNNDTQRDAGYSSARQKDTQQYDERETELGQV